MLLEGTVLDDNATGDTTMLKKVPSTPLVLMDTSRAITSEPQTISDRYMGCDSGHNGMSHQTKPIHRPTPRYANTVLDEKNSGLFRNISGLQFPALLTPTSLQTIFQSIIIRVIVSIFQFCSL